MRAQGRRINCRSFRSAPGRNQAPPCRTGAWPEPLSPTVFTFPQGRPRGFSPRLPGAAPPSAARASQPPAPGPAQALSLGPAPPARRPCHLAPPVLLAPPPARRRRRLAPPHPLRFRPQPRPRGGPAPSGPAPRPVRAAEGGAEHRAGQSGRSAGRGRGWREGAGAGRGPVPRAEIFKCPALRRAQEQPARPPARCRGQARIPPPPRARRRRRPAAGLPLAPSPACLRPPRVLPACRDPASGEAPRGCERRGGRGLPGPADPGGVRWGWGEAGSPGPPGRQRGVPGQGVSEGSRGGVEGETEAARAPRASMGWQSFRRASGPPHPRVRTQYRGLLAAPWVTSHPGPIGHFPDRAGRLPPPLPRGRGRGVRGGPAGPGPFRGSCSPHGPLRAPQASGQTPRPTPCRGRGGRGEWPGPCGEGSVCGGGGGAARTRDRSPSPPCHPGVAGMPRSLTAGRRRAAPMSLLTPGRGRQMWPW